MRGSRTEDVVRGQLGRLKGSPQQRAARLGRWYTGLLVFFALLFVAQYAVNATTGTQVSALPTLVVLVVLFLLRRALGRLVARGDLDPVRRGAQP